MNMDMEKNTNSKSIRLEMLKKIKQEAVGAKVVDFCLLEDKKILNNYKDLNITQWIKDSFDDVLRCVSPIEGNLIFAHPCPNDESCNPQISFAGVYKSYKPFTNRSKEENLYRGLSKVLLGRYSEYSDYYYSTHNINSNRKVSILFTAPVNGAWMFGTGYSFNGKCLFEYFNSPLSIAIKDPIKMAGDINHYKDSLSYKIIVMLTNVEKVLGVPVDVEFIITNKEEVVITEVRPISNVHLKNWNNIDEEVWRKYSGNNVESNVLNTIGKFAGTVVDLRKRKVLKDDMKDVEEKIYIINHHNGYGELGTSSLEFLKFINDNKVNNVSLIVEHDQTRIDDHLQYIIYEDPSIINIINTRKGQQFIDNRKLEIYSDGLIYRTLSK